MSQAPGSSNSSNASHDNYDERQKLRLFSCITIARFLDTLEEDAPFLTSTYRKINQLLEPHMESLGLRSLPSTKTIRNIWSNFVEHGTILRTHLKTGRPSKSNEEVDFLLNHPLQTMNQQSYVPLPYMSSPYAQNSILSSMVGTQSGHGGNAISRNMPMTSRQGQMPGSLYAGAPSYFPLYPNISVPHAVPGLLGFNPIVPGFEYERETVYLYIPSTMVGAIIGKSGSAIKEMTNTSGASIKVATAPTITELSNQSDNGAESGKGSCIESSSDSKEVSQDEVADSMQPPTSTSLKMAQKHSRGSNDCQTIMRKVTIVGYPGSQYSAQYMIYRKISLESGKGDVSLMVEIHVPSQLVGKVIGKGGATVKHLQKQTRTVIRIPDEKSGQPHINGDTSDHTSVQITGEFEGSQAAQRHIRNLIRESSHSRQNKSQNSRNNESNVVKNNAQSNSFANNNHQSDNGSVSAPSDSNDKSDETTKKKDTDKIAPESDENPLPAESPSCVSYHDRSHEGEPEEKSPGALQGSPSGSGDIAGGGDVVVSNNNTINNNLKASINEMPAAKMKDHVDDNKRGDHIENGDTVIQNRDPP